MSSTVKKGDAFEKRAYELIDTLVKNDDFFVPAKRSKVFQKKKYFSEKRKGDIIVDLSVETYLDNAPTYSFLTVIECKNVGRKVTVDDVEEFESKLRQIGEHNTKGIIITSSSFQKAAFNLAKSLKIGLLRLAKDEEYEWISYRRPKFIARVNNTELESAFTQDKLEGRNLIGIINDRPIYNVSELLIEASVIDFYQHKEKFIKFPYRDSKDIEVIVSRFREHHIYEEGKLNSEKLCKLLSESYKMEFDFDSELPNNLLGKIDFDPLKISITSNLKKEEHRWRFTLAHEIGHLVLHSKHLRYGMEHRVENDSTLSIDANMSDETNRLLEYQANLFARHVLMPDKGLLDLVVPYFKQENIHKGFLFLDDQPRNRTLVYGLLKKMSDYFDVSTEAAKVRLKVVGLLKDATDTSMYGLFKELNSKR